MYVLIQQYCKVPCSVLTDKVILCFEYNFDMDNTLNGHMGLDAIKPVFGGFENSKGASDQRLCYFLIGKCHIQICYKRNFNSLASHFS